MIRNPGQPRIIAIGASAGGVEALQALVSRLPGDCGAALIVAMHIGSRRSQLAELLARAGPLPAFWGYNGERLQPGRIYVAPPDHHLLVASDCQHLLLSRGPAENRTRPAIDPLFRSAAHGCGHCTTGVVLSGMLSDGTAGLAEIAGHGGVTVVQDPNEARHPSMPLSALRHVPVGHCLPVAGIADLLMQFCRQDGGRSQASSNSAKGRPAKGKDTGKMAEEYTLKRPVALTCPDCGGSLEQTSVGSLPYFECHIGHRYAAQNMDDAHFHELEKALGAALRMLNERTELARRLGERRAVAGSRSLPGIGIGQGKRQLSEPRYCAASSRRAGRGPRMTRTRRSHPCTAHQLTRRRLKEFNPRSAKTSLAEPPVPDNRQ